MMTGAKRRQLEGHQAANRDCAEIIASDPGKYQPGSLLAIWATRILEQTGVVPTERQAEVQHDTVSREEIQQRA